MNCPNCGRENPNQARFCRGCGQSLLPICPQCGQELAPDDQFCISCGAPLAAGSSVPVPTAAPFQASSTAAASQPSSFANGRYQVKQFLGEGGKKRVYLARDTLLDREVAFALIKTEGLDEAGRIRIQREGDRAKANALLDESLAISSELGMRPLMERVLSRREILEA